MANIILTGGNQGIGYFMAEKFLQNGDCVAVLDLENDNLRELKKEYPGRLLDCICDMRDAGGVVEARLPFTALGDVGKDGPHLGMQPAQDAEVVLVLVDRDEVGVTLRFQFDDEVLADQTGRAGKYDFRILGNHRAQHFRV